MNMLFLPHVSGFVVLDYYLRQAKSRRQEGDVFPLHFFPVSRTTISTMQRGCSKNKQAQLCFRAELFHASFIIVKTPPVLGDLCGGLHSCECHFSFGFQTISISCVNFPFLVECKGCKHEYLCVFTLTRPPHRAHLRNLSQSPTAASVAATLHFGVLASQLSSTSTVSQCRETRAHTLVCDKIRHIDN